MYRDVELMGVMQIPFSKSKVQQFLQNAVVFSMLISTGNLRLLDAVIRDKLEGIHERGTDANFRKPGKANSP
jgi:hypothetical protein